MKVLLAMLVKEGQEPYLDRMLSLVSPCFDGVELLSDRGRPVDDFAAARNQLIKTGERKGYDWIFMLDADECMFPEDIARVRTLMDGPQGFIVLPRVELVGDVGHWDPALYPDLQGRVFRLGVGYHYRNRLHEEVYRGLRHRPELGARDSLVSIATPIFHYGRTKQHDVIALKSLNYVRLAQHEPLLEAIPDDVDVEQVVSRCLEAMVPLDMPEPLWNSESAESVGPWARRYVGASTVSYETRLLSEHAEFLERVAGAGSPVLEVGVGSGVMGRYLAQRGHELTGIDTDTSLVTRAIRSASSISGVSYHVMDAFELRGHFPENRFQTAFSQDLLQHFDDDQVRRLITEQLGVARRVVASVPSDRNRSAVFGDERWRSAAEWRALLAPVARAEVSHYGNRFLPLRQALAAKIRGTLDQDDLHIMIDMPAR